MTETPTAIAIRLIREDEREACAKLVESFTADDIRMAAGEMTAQEMRSVKAVQRWWAAVIRGRSISSGEGA